MMIIYKQVEDKLDQRTLKGSEMRETREELKSSETREVSLYLQIY